MNSLQVLSALKRFWPTIKRAMVFTFFLFVVFFVFSFGLLTHSNCSVVNSNKASSDLEMSKTECGVDNWLIGQMGGCDD